MKGKNMIKINQTTMCEAVQLYFDSQFAQGKSPRVDTVRAVDEYGNIGNTAGGFEIETLAEGERDSKAEPSK